MFLELTYFLAQTNSSDMSDFFGQISGLLALTCGAGIVWMGLMALIFQRAAERRRRAAQGLPPLPGIHIMLFRWLTGRSGAPSPAPVSQPRDHRAPPVPTPDLSLLTGDLPQPQLADMVADVEPAPESEPQQVELAAIDEQTEEVSTPPQTEASRPLPVPPAEPLPRTEPAPDAPAPADAVELLRVWRDLSDGSLIVEIGGRRFQSLVELRSADLERRFLNVVRDLDGLAERKPASPAAPAQEGKTPVPKPDEPSTPSMTPSAMLRQMRRAAMGQTPEPVVEQPELSIADQIEDLLQERLADDPVFSQRAIHVKPALDGSVRIEVDGQYYSGVDEIEDEDVRALLTAVVREWEQRQ